MRDYGDIKHPNLNTSLYNELVNYKSKKELTSNSLTYHVIMITNTTNLVKKQRRLAELLTVLHPGMQY